MFDYHIAPSLLSADFANLGREIDAVLKAGADRIHVDVMDNHFVPNLTIGPMVCQSLRQHNPHAILDVHLMIQPVDNMIVPFIKAGASMILFHPEAVIDIISTIEMIRCHHCHVGFVFNPDTPYHVLTDKILSKLDCILVMLVYPGFAGQTLIDSTLKRVAYIRTKIAKYHIRLMVDGGVNLTNLSTIAKAGADSFVAGSAIFNSSDYKSTIQSMRRLLNSHSLS